LYEKIDATHYLKQIFDIDFNYFSKNNFKKIKEFNIIFSDPYYDKKIYEEIYKNFIENPENILLMSNF
jgi:16S rRNA G966 N2-methylase RsmD